MNPTSAGTINNTVCIIGALVTGNEARLPVSNTRPSILPEEHCWARGSAGSAGAVHRSRRPAGPAGLAAHRLSSAPPPPSAGPPPGQRSSPLLTTHFPVRIMLPAPALWAYGLTAREREGLVTEHLLHCHA